MRYLISLLVAGTALTHAWTLNERHPNVNAPENLPIESSDTSYLSTDVSTGGVAPPTGLPYPPHVPVPTGGHTSRVHHQHPFPTGGFPTGGYPPGGLPTGGVPTGGFNPTTLLTYTRAPIPTGMPPVPENPTEEEWKAWWEKWREWAEQFVWGPNWNGHDQERGQGRGHYGRD